ncbi:MULTISPECIES: flagellin N-terminal helical domain-containing protein [Rhizobium]|uniref:flagellin N-terminal helical domain-containing protein n=1 Tax=Rhizobium TaxID=379 RepID=UPI001F27A5C3|nr:MULTISPECIES: flagellin [Rhizobium]MDG3578720.1 flagellin [Rhizobium sp. YJ-22]
MTLHTNDERTYGARGALARALGLNMTSILTNTAATAALHTLRAIGSSLDKTQERVSSGLRVNTAADNAAYWSISTTMRSDSMAISAVADALGLGAATLDTAHAGMRATVNVLSEIRAKLVAANEPGVDKSKVQKEIQQLKNQVVTIASSSSFNGVNWLNTNILDINDNTNNKVSLTSSFFRSQNGGVGIGTTDFHLSETSLFNENGGGILQPDNRKMKTLGGIRNYDTYMDTQGIIHMDNTNTYGGNRGEFDFNFSGPLTFNPGDIVSFDVTVDADNPADVDPPYNPGKTTHVVIDRNLIDTWMPSANGVISNFVEYTLILNRALAQTNSGALTTNVSDSHGGLIPNRIVFATREDSGLDGSSVELTNFYSDVGSGGLSDTPVHYGIRGSRMPVYFVPFQVFTDGDNYDGVKVNFQFSVNGASATNHEFDRTYVNNLLGKTDGKIDTPAEMVTLLQSLIGTDWPDVIIEVTGPTEISLRSDKTVDRLSGRKTAIGFTGIFVSIEPLAEQNFLDIDIGSNPQKIGIYLGYMDVVLADAIGAGTKLGSIKTRIDMQTDFAHTLKDTLDKGIGRLVDADMDEASTRIKALQTQQQLAIQALQIANNNAEHVMQLFRQ